MALSPVKLPVLLPMVVSRIGLYSVTVSNLFTGMLSVILKIKMILFSSSHCVVVTVGATAQLKEVTPTHKM